MNHKNKTLWGLKEGRFGVVSGMKIDGAMRRRLQDIGIINGTKIVCVRKSHSGDPTAYLIRGAVVALRKNESENIFLK